MFKIFLPEVKELLEYLSKTSVWEKIFLVYIIIGIIIFFLYSIIYRRKVFGETGTLKYESGYPDFDDSAEGIIVIENDKIIFKEFSGDKIFFSISLKQIVDVSTYYKTLYTIHWHLWGYGIFGERKYLFITFHKDDKGQIVRFSTHRHSSINKKLKKEILEAKSKLL